MNRSQKRHLFRCYSHLYLPDIFDNLSSKMEREILKSIEAAKKTSEVDEAIFTAVKEKHGSIYTDDEIWAAINSYPSNILKENYQRLNFALMGLLILDLGLTLFNLSVIVKSQGFSTKAAIVTLILGGIFALLIRGYLLFLINKFQRWGYLLTSGLVLWGLCDTEGISWTVSAIFEFSFPTNAYLLLTLLLPVALFVLPLYLVKKMFPNTTLLGKPKPVKVG